MNTTGCGDNMGEQPPATAGMDRSLIALTHAS
jgi:hypothetical protein